MPIEVGCECGKRFRAPDSAAGKRARCSGCGQTLTVPSPPVSLEASPFDEGFVDVAPPALQRATVAPRTIAHRDHHAAATGAAAYQPTAARPAVSAPAAPQLNYAAGPSVGLAGSPLLPPPVQRSRRSYLYLLLLVALLPLAMSTVSAPDAPFTERLTQTLNHNPESAKAFDDLMDQKFKSSDDAEKAIFNILPQHRVEGAWLPRDTFTHWLLAIIAGGAFFGTTIVVFPSGRSKSLHLLWVGLFTGTIGILLLLGVQLAASVTQGVIIIPRGIIGILFWIVKLIGLSYRSAVDPEVGWFPSFLGFTAGVGICEELCKSLPLLWHYRNEATLDWRGACRWGFISGVGFGVSEGITFCSDFYNGISGGDMYLVRFASCVTLHAVWSAAAGIMICRRQQQLQDADNLWALAGQAIFIVGVPIILHGAYDTLLKKDHDGWALAVALASFAWLALQVEKMLKKERAAQAFGMPSLA